METSKKMNVAITGANGFIGTELIRELKERKISYEALNRQKHDLFNMESLKDFVSNKDIIVHLAGVNKDGSLEDILKVNILGTKTLLDAIITYNKNVKLIFASSFGIYQEHEIFGLSKKIAEELINKYTSKHGFKSIILRYSNIYGLGARPFANSAITTFVHLAKEGKPIAFHGDGAQTRDYLYIDDAIQALLASFEINSQKTETYNVCSGTATSLNELVKIIGTVSKKPVLIKKVKSIRTQQVKKHPIKLRLLPNWNPEISLKKGLKIVMNKTYEN